MNDYIIDLLVDAILEDICRRTDEWADPTGDKAVKIANLHMNTAYNRKENSYYE